MRRLGSKETYIMKNLRTVNYFFDKIVALTAHCDRINTNYNLRIMKTL